MNNTGKMQAVVVGVLGLAVGLLSGCAEPVQVELSSTRSANVEIPAQVKRLAVAEFACTEPTNAPWGSPGMRMPGMPPQPAQSSGAWGSVAADKLCAGLDCCNQEFKRYVLVDHRHLASILSEIDLIVMNSAGAAKVGKLADVQAVIYGTVVVKSSDEMAQKMYFNIMAMTIMPKYYTKRYVYVSVNLTMDDVGSTKTLHTRTITQEFDSDKDKKGLASVLGFSSDNPEPVDKTVNKMVDICVQEFVADISAHRIHVLENLENAGGKLVEEGNTLAKVREYAEALDCYKKALAQTPKDAKTNFNAGLMCEVQNDLANAKVYYEVALSLDSSNVKYANARKRVKDEVEIKHPAKVETSAVGPP